MPSKIDSKILALFKRVIQETRETVGATAPNPPVGAAGLDLSGNLLSLQVHLGAGAPHAEAKVISDLKERGKLSELHTLLVTLEPCNHHGRTPPCTETILSSPVQEIFFGSSDPNPKVKGGGEAKLNQEGKICKKIDSLEIQKQCDDLIKPFSVWSRLGLPFVVVKTAHQKDISDFRDSMIPPRGSKTFTSESSLTFAHQLRKESDAILTGSGTVLADQPEFTVRKVRDHQDRPRYLVILDRRKRVPESYVLKAQALGWSVLVMNDYTEALQLLGNKGVLQVLVEAGPQLSQAILHSGKWNRHVVITQGTPDEIDVRHNDLGF